MRLTTNERILERFLQVKEDFRLRIQKPDGIFYCINYQLYGKVKAVAYLLNAINNGRFQPLLDCITNF
jgi:hypothetical protein